MTFQENALHLIARAARSSAAVATKEWAELISVPRRYLSGEVFECFQVIGAPLRPTIPGELVRVHLNLSGDELSALMFKAALRHELEPFIIGVGEVRVYDTSEGIIVLRRDLWDQILFSRDHDDSPRRNDETISASSLEASQ